MRTLFKIVALALLLSADYPANAPEIQLAPAYELWILPIEMPREAEKGVMV